MSLFFSTFGEFTFVIIRGRFRTVPYILYWGRWGTSGRNGGYITPLIQHPRQVHTGTRGGVDAPLLAGIGSYNVLMRQSQKSVLEPVGRCAASGVARDRYVADVVPERSVSGPGGGGDRCAASGGDSYI